MVRMRRTRLFRHSGGGALRTGGALLGYGRRSTVVYTADDLSAEMPMLRRLCIVEYVRSGQIHARGPGAQQQNQAKAQARSGPSHGHELCIQDDSADAIQARLLRVARDGPATRFAQALGRSQRHRGHASRLAIKDCGDSADAEIAANERLFAICFRAGALDLTILHPRISYLDAYVRVAQQPVDPFLRASAAAIPGAGMSQQFRGNSGYGQYGQDGPSSRTLTHPQVSTRTPQSAGFPGPGEAPPVNSMEPASPPVPMPLPPVNNIESTPPPPVPLPPVPTPTPGNAGLPAGLSKTKPKNAEKGANASETIAEDTMWMTQTHGSKNSSSRNSSNSSNSKNPGEAAYEDESVYSLERRRLPVYRALDGCVAELVLVMDMPEQDLLLMSCRVLQLLVLLHSNGCIHMDIKPDNILYIASGRKPPGRRSMAQQQGNSSSSSMGGDGSSAARTGKRTTRAAAEDEDDQVKFDFRLADYETVEEATFVAAHVQRSTLHSFSQGTDGYMSPLLTADDSSNGVYPRFEAVARACGVPRPAVGWAGFFERAKQKIGRHIYRIDLHSLGLTLLDMMRLGDPASPESFMDAARYPRLRKLIPHLMFMRKGRDFDSAAEALRAFIQALSSTSGQV